MSLFLLASGCSASGSTRTGICSSVDLSGTDALANVCRSAAVRVATNWRNKPRSWYDRSTATWKGFDVDVAREIATRLGVQARIERIGTGAGNVVAASDTYDMAVASMEPTHQGKRAYRFSPAYYFTPASIAVDTQNASIQDLTTDLDGKAICVSSGSPYESYLNRSLTLPATAPKFRYIVNDPRVVRFPTEADALAALGNGADCDAVLAALPAIAGSIQTEQPIKIVGDPLFYEPLAIAFDKDDVADPRTLVAAVDRIVQDMHADGTLTALSQEWFGGEDLTTVAPNVG